MKAFSFARLIFIFVVVAFFGSFQSTENEVSLNLFEQSFIRLKLRGPLSKDDKKSLKNQRKVLGEKLANARISGDKNKTTFYEEQLKRIEEKLGE